MIGTMQGTSAFRRFARSNPVTAFLLGVLLLSGGAMTLAVLVRFGVLPGRDVPAQIGLDMEEAASFALVMSLFAAAAGVTWLEGGRDAVVVLLRRMLRWRVDARWWLVAAAGLPASTVLLAVLLGDSARIPAAGTLAAELAAFLVAMLLINVFEESAWTGFMQTHLERRHNVFVAALCSAVPFSLVHLPIRVISGEATTGAELVSSFVSLMIFTPVIRTLFGAVVRGAGNSVLLAAVAHTAFNRSNNEDGLAADILSGDARQDAALLATLLVTVVALAMLRRRGLGRARRLELDGAEARGAQPSRRRNASMTSMTSTR